MDNTIDKELIRQRFARRLESYESQAVIQQQIAGVLASEFARHTPGQLENVVEIGCGTGFLTRKIVPGKQIGTLYLNDLVEQALTPVEDKIRRMGYVGNVRLLPGDAESLEIPVKPDTVVSASVMQWFNDLPGFFRKTAEQLTDGGTFAFNLFGPENLRQITELTGMGLNYLTLDELRELLNRDFEAVELFEKKYRHHFNTPFDVLRHLQLTGVTGTGTFRWTKQSLREFERQYTLRYSEGKGVELTWHVLYAIARKR